MDEIMDTIYAILEECKAEPVRVFQRTGTVGIEFEASFSSWKKVIAQLADAGLEFDSHPIYLPQTAGRYLYAVTVFLD
jgi:hypothetical protein